LTNVGEASIIIKIISYIRYEYSVSKVGVVMDQWGWWAVGIWRNGVVSGTICVW